MGINDDIISKVEKCDEWTEKMFAMR
jgi:hypothetical protein